jgi:tetratricopeptide (TPR) repeat protein
MDFDDFVSQGQEYAQKKEFQLAIDAFERAKELNRDPDNAGILENMIDGYKKAIVFQQQASQAALNEARQRAEVMGYNVEDVDKVIAEYKEAFGRSPNDNWVKNSLASAYYIRAVTFTAKRDHARAIADYSDAININRDYPLAFNKRGQEYLDNCDFDRAIADFNEMGRFNQDDSQYKNMVNNLLADAYMKRGQSNDMKGDYDSAIQDFEKVLQFNPDNNTARELIKMAQAEKAGKVS